MARKRPDGKRPDGTGPDRGERPEAKPTDRTRPRTTRRDRRRAERARAEAPPSAPARPEAPAPRDRTRPAPERRAAALAGADGGRRRGRTRAKRPRRLFRRITPRRWLPFAAFVAVVAGAVVVAGRDRTAEPLTRAVTTPGEMLPVAAPTDALSTAFFCPGGSALGEDGEAELAVVVANARASAARAEVTLVGSDGDTERVDLDVPAFGRARVVAADHVETPWAAATVEVLGGDVAVQQQVRGTGVGSDLAPCPTATSDTWYAPDASTAIGAEHALLVYNPFPAPAVVSVGFVSGGVSSTPRDLQSITIPGATLRVIDTEDLPARKDHFATRVTTRLGRVVVGRVQRFDGEGEPFEAVREAPEVAAPDGLAATPAVPVTSTRWVFPSAVNQENVRNAIAVYNPNEGTAEINLVLSYANRSVNAEIEPVQVTVRGGEQEIVDLRDRPGLDDGAPYTIVLDSFANAGAAAVPVVAELQTFNGVYQAPLPAERGTEPPAGEGDGEGDQPRETSPDAEDEEVGETSPDAEEEAPPAEPEPVVGFAAIAGSPAAANRWLVADVDLAAKGVADVVVFNPGTDPVGVAVEVVADGRRQRIDSFELDRGDRRSLDLGDLDEHVSLVVTSSGGAVVVGQTWVGAKRGVSAAVANPVPGTVRTLPPPFLG